VLPPSLSLAKAQFLAAPISAQAGNWCVTCNDTTKENGGVYNQRPNSAFIGLFGDANKAKIAWQNQACSPDPANSANSLDGNARPPADGNWIAPGGRDSCTPRALLAITSPATTACLLGARDAGCSQVDTTQAYTAPVSIVQELSSVVETVGQVYQTIEEPLSFVDSVTSVTSNPFGVISIAMAVTSDIRNRAENPQVKTLAGSLSEAGLELHLVPTGSGLLATTAVGPVCGKIESGYINSQQDAGEIALNAAALCLDNQISENVTCGGLSQPIDIAGVPVSAFNWDIVLKKVSSPNSCCLSSPASRYFVNTLSLSLDGFQSCSQGSVQVNARPQIVPGVLGAQTEDSITATESGRYVFFQNGQIVAEKDVVVEGDTLQIKLYVDINGNGVKDNTEEYISDYSQISIAKDATAVSYPLQTGWNFIRIPMVDGRLSNPIRKASELLQYWNNQGADIVHIAKFEAGKFVFYSMRENGEVFSPDFTLLPGQGLAVFNRRPNIRLSFSGNRITQSLPLQMSNGWNLIGVIAPGKTFSSESLLSAFNSQGFTADTVSSYQNGSYQSVVQDKSILFGNNFNIIDSKSYFVRINSQSQPTFSP